MNYLNAFFNSFSQVFLIENRIFGLLIFASIAIIQPRMGLYSIIGVAICFLMASLLGIENSTFNAGIMGFNSVLIGVVAAVLLPKLDLAILATIIASIAAILIQYAAMKYKIPVYTGPFVLAALAIFFLKSYFKF
ncbi:MAG: urea transporter [Patescibacteria group bacterium]|nr:urea transporter [Patescibacteria group bacterium]